MCYSVGSDPTILSVSAAKARNSQIYMRLHPKATSHYAAAGCKKLCVRCSLESQFIGNRLAPARGLCLIGVLP